jgi:hypothetical protein
MRMFREQFAAVLFIAWSEVGLRNTFPLLVYYRMEGFLKSSPKAYEK